MKRIQEKLPPNYMCMKPDELKARISARKDQLGSSLCILGHHYQGDDVIQFADFTGDSLKLSQIAASQQDARYIVFCGVRFMAESAATLASEKQAVILPNLEAGCSMADMADEEEFEAALKELAELTTERVVPISYVNSSAGIKAITGRAGGACCTSSNVRSVFEWALRSSEQGGGGAAKVLMIPDEHLGRSIAFSMGHSEADCAVYDPALPTGGLDREKVSRATFILWKGHCYVHQLFRAEHVRKLREQDPDAKVIVHPECPYDVVEAADAFGSTEQIIQAVRDSAPGTHWAIGTESNMVERLAQQCPDRSIRVLSDGRAVCVQMKRIDTPHLLWVLDNLAEGKIVNRITVPQDVIADARIALERMIATKAVSKVTAV